MNNIDDPEGIPASSGIGIFVFMFLVVVSIGGYIIHLLW